MPSEADGGQFTISETALRSRLDWYATLPDEFDHLWFGPRQHEWRERLHAELPNIRTALSFTVEHPDQTSTGFRLVGDLNFVWRVSAMRKGQTWLDRLLLAHPRIPGPRKLALVRSRRWHGFWVHAVKKDPPSHPRLSWLARNSTQSACHGPMFIKGVLMSPMDPPKALADLEKAIAEAEGVRSTADQAYALSGLAWCLGLD